MVQKAHSPTYLPEKPEPATGGGRLLRQNTADYRCCQSDNCPSIYLLLTIGFAQGLSLKACSQVPVRDFNYGRSPVGAGKWVGFAGKAFKKRIHSG